MVAGKRARSKRSRRALNCCIQAQGKCTVMSARLGVSVSMSHSRPSASCSSRRACGFTVSSAHRSAESPHEVGNQPALHDWLVCFHRVGVDRLPQPLSQNQDIGPAQHAQQVRYVIPHFGPSGTPEGTSYMAGSPQPAGIRCGPHRRRTMP